MEDEPWVALAFLKMACWLSGEPVRATPDNETTGITGGRWNGGVVDVMQDANFNITTTLQPRDAELRHQ
jgi:hypothetical protein